MSKVLNFVEKVQAWSCYFFLSAMIFVGFIAIVLRYVFSAPLVWSQELIIALNIWFVFFGAAVVLKKNRHISLTFVINYIKNPKLKVSIEIIGKLMMLIFLGYIIVGTIKIQPMQIKYTTPALQIPRNYLSIPMGLSAIVMFATVTVQIWEIVYKVKKGGGDPARKNGDD